MAILPLPRIFFCSPEFLPKFFAALTRIFNVYMYAFVCMHVCICMLKCMHKEENGQHKLETVKNKTRNTQ